MGIYQPPDDLAAVLQGRLLDLIEAHLTQVLMSVPKTDLLADTAFSRDLNYHEFNLSIMDPRDKDNPIRIRIKVENQYPTASKVQLFKKGRKKGD